MGASFWHVGDVVRKLRLMRGWTGAGLAKRASVDKSVVSRLEQKGGEQTTVATLTALATALDVTVAELYRIAEQEPISQELLARLHQSAAKTEAAMLRILRAPKKKAVESEHH